MSRINDPLGDGGGGPDPIDDPPPDPIGEVPLDDGDGYAAHSLAAQGRPIPILYGTRKVTALVLDKTAPARMVIGSMIRRAATTYYNQGEYVVILTYCKTGAVSGLDCIWRCTTSGTSGADPDFNGATLYSIGDVVTTDGSVDWEMVAVWGQTDPEKWVPIIQGIVLALCEGEAQGSLQMWWDKERVTAASLTNPTHGLTIQLGTDALGNAVPSPFDTTIDYQHTAIAYGTSIPTGNKEEIPALAFEMQGVMLGAATRDVSPADIINDLLTHSRRGCEMSTSRVDTSITGTAASGYRVYCDAFGLRLSMLIDTQRSALSLIADVLRATNSDALWSQGTVKVVPLGDVASTSPVYGATNYSPANTSQYALGVDDFLDKGQPVQVIRRPDADCFNSWPVEYIDGEGGSYPRLTVEDPDQSDVDVRGLHRAGTTVLPFSFPTASRAVMLSRIFAQRSLNVRNTYRFRLSWKYILLEPCDIVTLTEPELGLSARAVRILSITEGDDYTLSFEAEDYPSAVQGALTYTPQAGDGYESNDRSTVPPAAVDGGTMSMGVSVVTAAAVAAAACGDATLTRSNFNNLWPNPSSEMAPPVGADETQPEWYGRTFMAPAWIATHAYTVGQTCTNGGLGYIVTVAGTSHGSGGPTGTGTNIVDGVGTLRWDYESSTVQTGTPYGGNYVRRLDTEQTSFYAPCAEGQSFLLSVKGARISGALGPSVGISFVDTYDNVLSANTNYSASTSWTTVSLVATAPANAVRALLVIFDTGGVSVFDALLAVQQIDTSALVPSGTQYQVLTTVAGAATWADGSKKVLTTTGDLLHASAANTPARLAIGTTDQELVVAAGLPSWYSGAKKLLDATGAMLYASAANVLAKLGIGSSGQVLTVSGGVPTWATPAAAFAELYSIDFTAESTQDFKAGGDGNYTIGGKNWKVTGTAAATTFKILNGTGIQIAPSNAGSAALEMRASLDAMSSSCAPTLRPIELWYRATFASYTTNLQDANCGLTSYAGTITDWLLRNRLTYDGSAAWVVDSYYNGAQIASGSRPRSTNSLTDDVIVLRLVSSSQVECFTGVYSAGWPATDALHRRGLMELFAPSSSTIKSPEVNDFAAYLGAFASANGSSMTVTNFRIMG